MKTLHIFFSILISVFAGLVCGLFANVNPVLGLCSLPIAALIGKVAGLFAKQLK